MMKKLILTLSPIILLSACSEKESVLEKKTSKEVSEPDNKVTSEDSEANVIILEPGAAIPLINEKFEVSEQVFLNKRPSFDFILSSVKFRVSDDLYVTVETHD